MLVCNDCNILSLAVNAKFKRHSINHCTILCQKDMPVFVVCRQDHTSADVTCQLADNFRKLVMVVDTSEEIAGGGHVPHACIGSARRMLGSSQQSKYEALQEAVSNHGPEVRQCCAVVCDVSCL